MQKAVLLTALLSLLCSASLGARARRRLSLCPTGAELLLFAGGCGTIDIFPIFVRMVTVTATVLSMEPDFTARWLSPDPLAEKYYGHSPYLFCAGNPVRFVDPEGTSTREKQLDDGTYEVIGGDLYDNDFGIYVGYYGDDGSWVPTGNKPIGYTSTLYSFYNSDKGPDHGWQTGTIINPNDTMGASFLSTIRAGVTLTEYMDKARSGHQWDVKLTNNTEKVIEGIDIYRGMPIGSKNGIPVYASARDVGNIAAGIVAGAHGMSWLTARLGFDLYQSWSVKYLSVEGFSTQYAQLYGWRRGHKQWLDVIGRMNKDNYYAF